MANNVRRYDARTAAQETKEEVFGIRPRVMPEDEKEDLMAIRLETQERARKSRSAAHDAANNATEPPTAPETKPADDGAVDAFPVTPVATPAEKPVEKPVEPAPVTPAEAPEGLRAPGEPVKPAQPDLTAANVQPEPLKPEQPAKPAPEPQVPFAGRCPVYPEEYLRMFMRPETRMPEPPVRSSATIDYANYDGDVLMTGTLVREAQYIIDTLHDTGHIDPRLKVLAVQAISSDDEWATDIFKKASHRKPVEYKKQEFYYLIDKTGAPRPNSPLFSSMEAAKNSFGAQRLNEMKNRKINFDKLIGHATWYIDASGKRIQPVSQGEPKAPPVKINIPATVVDHGAEYLRRFHDTGVVHPDLADLLEQILLSDEKALNAAKAEKARRDLARRPKMKVGYYTTDKRRPSETPEAAKAAYLEAYERRWGSAFVDLILQGDGSIDIPEIQATAYYVSDFGGYGDPVEDRALSKACLREAGLLKDDESNKK